MSKLILLPNLDAYWGRIATLLNGEQGEITGTYKTDNGKFYSAVFPIYGGEFSWIPAAFCTVSDTVMEPPAES